MFPASFAHTAAKIGSEVEVDPFKYLHGDQVVFTHANCNKLDATPINFELFLEPWLDHSSLITPNVFLRWLEAVPRENR